MINPGVKRETAPPTLAGSTLLVLCSTLLISMMNSSMTTVALPDMQRDFVVTPDELSWVVAAFLIPFAAGTVVYGRLADLFDTRRIYLFGLTLFAVASLAVAVAPSFELMIAARVLQGLGGTAVPSLSMATIVRTTNPQQRAHAMGITIVTVGIGFGLGPIVGGALTEWGSWRAPYIAASSAAFILLPAAAATLPSLKAVAGERFDYWGALFLTAAVTGDIIALNRLPHDAGDPYGLAGLAVSLPLWAGVVVRTVTVREPFIDRELASNARFMGLSAAGFAAQGTHFAAVVLIPLLLARYHDMSALQIGLHLLPGALALALFGLIGGALANRIGNGLLLVIGCWLLFVAALTFHLSGVGWSPAGISLLYVVLAAGYGMVNACVVNAATAELPEESTGVAVGLFNLTFFLGGAAAVALAGAVLRARSTALEAFDPIFPGRAIEFSDAMLVVTGFAAAGFLLAVRFAPLWKPERFRQAVADAVAESEVATAESTTAASVHKWALKPRAKPNA